MVYDLATDDGLFITQICTLMGGNELRTLLRRMHGAKEEIRKRGGFPSSEITLPRGVGYTRNLVNGIDMDRWHYIDEEVAAVQEAWRYQHFTTIQNTGTAADCADPDQDSLCNLLERAFNLNPNQSGFPFLSPTPAPPVCPPSPPPAVGPAFT